MIVFDRCPNCEEPQVLCQCTFAEIQQATIIRRQQHREWLRKRGKPVLVDHFPRGKP